MAEQRKNLRKYIIPALISNLSFFVLTIVDGMFVGNGIGPDALGAVSLAMPFVTIVWALGNLFDIGGAAVAAVCFGRGDTAGANKVFMHVLSANTVCFSALTLIGTLFSGEIAVLLGANDIYVQMVSDYVFWFSVFLLPASLGPCMSIFARNDGNPKFSLAFAMTCTVSNIVGDWLMVYPLQMGISGAAMATGASYLLGTLVVMMHYLGKRGQLRICRFRVDVSLYRKIIVHGIPELISQFATTVTVFSMNNVLIRSLGNAAVNGYSIITYAGSLFSSLMWGLSGGLQPLYGHSYGRKDETSLKYYFRSGLILALAGGLLVFALTFAAGKPLGSVYGADGDVASIVCSALPKYSLHYVFAAPSTVIAAYLFSTERTRYAIPINMFRSIVFNFVCINFLPLVFGYEFVWYTAAVAEGLCLLIAAVLCRISEKNGIVYR